MGKTTGGPLLCVDDLMKDLLLDDSLSLQSISNTSQSSGGSVGTPSTRSLKDAFEGTYKDLELALASSGHSWTSLTQQLYSALISANEVAATAESNLLFLAEKIASLRAVLEQGDAAIDNLRAVVTQLQIHGD